MKHIILLGDSIFDNKAYVADGLDVITHLRQQIPDDWKAFLLAVDGSTVENVGSQTSHLPGDSTHLVVSVGGNDGGRKIAASIVRMVREHNFESRRTEVFF